MARCSYMGRMLTLLTCWLTVAASGDDFNFVRLIFPSLFSVGASLPLDDPNEDFCASCGEGSRPLPTRSHESPGPLAIPPTAACRTQVDFSQPLYAHLPGARHFCRSDMNPPLLC